MFSHHKAMILSIATLAVGLTGLRANADWNTFVIREGVGGAPVIQTNNTYVPGATEFITSGASQKAGWGSSDINGQTIGSINQLSIIRYDDPSRFTAGSGPAVAPYFNIWITDGTHYAVVANEPSDANMQALFNNGWSLSFADISNKVAKVYEITDKSWLPNNGVGLTFADLADFTIQSPSVAELTAGWTGLGTGAPRELNTNAAYGVNWIFGDTLSNYVSGAEGYVVGSPGISAVPEPASLTLLALGSAALLLRRRRA